MLLGWPAHGHWVMLGNTSYRPPRARPPEQHSPSRRVRFAKSGSGGPTLNHFLVFEKSKVPPMGKERGVNKVDLMYVLWPHSTNRVHAFSMFYERDCELFVQTLHGYACD